jgi:hypothetical protein
MAVMAPMAETVDRADRVVTAPWPEQEALAETPALGDKEDWEAEAVLDPTILMAPQVVVESMALQAFLERMARH